MNALATRNCATWSSTESAAALIGALNAVTAAT